MLPRHLRGSRGAGCRREPTLRVAIVGSGIAGLGAALELAPSHDVVVLERQARAGGHSNTIAVTTGDGRVLPLDTGFLVHNERNYPNLMRLFSELGVATQDSEMSFSVACLRCGLEYSGRRPFAQPANLVRPRFLRMLGDTVRYLRTAGAALEAGRLDGRTLAQYVEDERFSPAFRDHFLVPLTAALWSTAPGQALDFPIAHAVRFFQHHGMLGFGRFRWRTVCGGSQSYVRAIAERLGPRLRLATPVRTISRHADGVEIRLEDDGRELADVVVLATHADEALALLADASEHERRLLGAIASTSNETVLHTDERLLPRRRAARASWNYQLADCRSGGPLPTMTYYLNRLQALDEPLHYCVTLNRSAEIDEDQVIERMVYRHPLFTVDGLRARAELPSIQGTARTWFCGAWQGFGFHEDGLVSGIRVAREIGTQG